MAWLMPDRGGSSYQIAMSPVQKCC